MPLNFTANEKAYWPGFLSVQPTYPIPGSHSLAFFTITAGRLIKALVSVDVGTVVFSVSVDGVPVADLTGVSESSTTEVEHVLSDPLLIITGDHYIELDLQGNAFSASITLVFDSTE